MMGLKMQLWRAKITLLKDTEHMHKKQVKRTLHPEFIHLTLLTTGIDQLVEVGCNLGKICR
jgi:hypothetical protein